VATLLEKAPRVIEAAEGPKGNVVLRTINCEPRARQDEVRTACGTEVATAVADENAKRTRLDAREVCALAERRIAESIPGTTKT
jgi:hypothetical protein